MADKPVADGRSGRSIIGAQPWLTTLADLVSLLLAFMVLTFAGMITTPGAGEPFADRAARAGESDSPGIAAEPEPPAAPSLDYLALILNRSLEADEPSSSLVVRRRSQGLSIVIATEHLFPAHDAELAPGLAGRLQRLAPLLPIERGPVQVFGVGEGAGTDADRDLALRRALAVAAIIGTGRRPAVAYGFESSAIALDWLKMAEDSAVVPAAASIVMQDRGEPQ